MKTSLPISFVLFFVAACGGSQPAPATDPASATGAATPSESTPASTTPAPSDGKCKSGEASAASKDLDACKADCQKLSDQAPPGSRCVPERTSCMMSCDQKFKK